MKKRAFYSAEQRQQLLSDFLASGLTATEFARQHGLSRVLLSVWRRRYGRQPPDWPLAKSPSSGIVLQEVKLEPGWGPPGWAAEVLLPTGLRVRLDAVGRAQLLAQLLKVC